ncbi:hypothetical protein POM88_053911 [Heracleum sosnowskyi]|uniref:DNA topoisomerase (ATP-hydrolyzing) n=1 Tax=Heracleum sosnowskyi TaxID=360622 RepID=A0AAD8GNS4_9APIA|nr:hypothetical protein POM88_053911 [Heracleum sosnowskyi]
MQQRKLGQQPTLFRKWSTQYKKFLESIMTGNHPLIKDCRDNGDEVTIKLLVTLSKENMLMAKQEGLLKIFNLTTTISTGNMHLFDSEGVLKKYDNPEQIIEDFFRVRLDFYKKWQNVLLENLKLDLMKLENKIKFIQGVLDRGIGVGRTKKDLLLELKNKGFKPFPEKTKVDDYDYLLQMDIGALTLERVKKIVKERDKLDGYVNKLRKATPISLWNKDLDALVAKLDAQDERDAAEEVACQEMHDNGPGCKPSRQAPEDPPKINTATVAKRNGKAEGKKEPIVKQGKSTSNLRDEDDDHNLRDRLAAFNLKPSPVRSEAKEVELRKEAKKKPLSRKKGSAANEDEMSIDNENIVLKVATKKKNQSEMVGQMLITDFLNPVENDGTSPKRKVGRHDP